MFVVSVKGTRVKWIAAIAAAVVFLLLAVGFFVSRKAASPAGTLNGVNLRAETAEERVAFFSQFGWEIDEEPVEVKEVVIPTGFDDVYTDYNELQKQQNFDLTPYQGVRVKSWSYHVRNYPGYENEEDVIRGNILVYDGVVIGGDISDIALDGFMQTFERPENAESIEEDPVAHLVE